MELIQILIFKPDNNSYWVIGSDRRSSWVDEVPEDNPITEGEWWDLTKPEQATNFLRCASCKRFKY